MGPSSQQHGVDSGIGKPMAPGPRTFSVWRVREERLRLDAPVVMGILNLTPDSFSDGGSLTSVGEALEKARRMEEEGAGILDVGGESTRPGADPVPLEAELERVIPFIERASEVLSIPLSIDSNTASHRKRAACTLPRHTQSALTGFGARSGVSAKRKPASSAPSPKDGREVRNSR